MVDEADTTYLFWIAFGADAKGEARVYKGRRRKGRKDLIAGCVSLRLTIPLTTGEGVTRKGNEELGVSESALLRMAGFAPSG